VPGLLLLLLRRLAGAAWLLRLGWYGRDVGWLGAGVGLVLGEVLVCCLDLEPIRIFV